MSIELIKFGFTAGELAPAFYGRPDLEKFDFGLARAYNWFVDYRGGLSSRPGFRFFEFLKADDQPIMMFEFRFNTDLGNTYAMIFGHEYIRFVQDGAYITEDPKTPSAITKANPGVVTTAAAHGLVDGDYVFFNNLGEMTELEHKACVVNATGDTTFEIYDVSGYAAAESDGGTEQCQKVNALVIDTSYNLLDPDLTAAGSDIGAISLTIPWPDTNPLRIPDDYATLTAAIAAGITLIAGDNITIASGTTEPGALDLSGDDGTAGTEIVFTLEGDWTLAAGGLILGDYYIINCQGNSIIGPITFGDNVTSSKCQFKPE